MRRSKLWWMLGAALLVGLAVATACDEDTGPGDDGLITLDEFDEAYAQALCSVFLRCPAMGGDDTLFMTGGTTSESACVSRLREALTLTPMNPADMYRIAVERGAGTWDASLAADCFDLMSGATCDDFLSGALGFEHAECNEMFQGSVPAASPCYRDLECADGWCDTESACPGTCVAYAAPGAPCGTTGAGDCGPGYVCGATLTCVAATATTLLGEGQPCGSYESECRYGLYCDEGTESCRAYLAENAACGEGTAQCTPGTACHPTELRCTRVQFSTSAGTPCGEGTTSVCDPLENLYCDPTTSRCVRLPGAGEPCMSLGYFSVCGVGLYCAGEVCRAKLADGAACELDSWCQSGECRGFCQPVAESCGSGDPF